MDLFSGLTQQPPTRPCLTVSQITSKVKGLLEGEIGEVWVRGEISNFRPSAAGHLYFNLKDTNAVISCALFKNTRAKFEFKDGVEVMAHGRISVYAPRGNYQLIIDHIEPVGAGALQAAFEALKAKLQKEGLFELARKREIPPHPSKIAIVTSPTGAALQDILNVLGRRNAGISVLVVPTLVQGDAAPAQIVAAIETVNQHKLADVIIVARGGGSLEDLWCFNDEAVVRAVSTSKIPVISAVGHEVDFTLCDFAADLRAATPSAAAELVSKNRLELLENVVSFEKRMLMAVSHRLSSLKNQLLALENKLVSPHERLAKLRNWLIELELRLSHSVQALFPHYRQMLDETQARATRAVERKLEERKRKLEGISGRLEALSPLKVLGRGYTLVQDAASKELVKSFHELRTDQVVSLTFHDGKTKAKIL